MEDTPYMAQYVSEVTAVSTKGQVVLPKSIRDELKLDTGTKLMVFTDGENILLKPILQPSVAEFSGLLDAAQKWASDAGMTKADIDDAVKAVRKRKKAAV